MKRVCDSFASRKGDAIPDTHGRFLGEQKVIGGEFRWGCLLIGVGKPVRPAPLPPNRTGGFPAYGYPVSRFPWIERTEYGLHAG